MIIHQLLLSSLLAWTALAAPKALAQKQTEELCDALFPVLERRGKKNYEFKLKTLKDLKCKSSFEGKHFKIVYATENDPIPFNAEDQALVQKAANVYHHLTVARDFWVNEIGSEYVRSLPQTTVRLDITNAFSSARHFKHAEQEKNYNNAWTIPEGETPRFVREKRSWGKEIWFSPMKKLESRKGIKSKGNNPVHGSLQIVKEPVMDHATNSLLFQGLSWVSMPQMRSGAVIENALPYLGAMAILYTALETTKQMDKWFVDKYFFIDTAMVPEVIYHEYAHIALSDTMKTVHSVPVIEGMADYFATRVAKKEKMYSQIKDFSKNKHKDIKNKSYYHPYLEASWNATSDFTLSLLWHGRESVNKFNKKRQSKGRPALINYDQLVYEAHYELTESSDISNDLVSALLNACNNLCANKRAGTGILHQVFEDKGMN